MSLTPPTTYKELDANIKTLIHAGYCQEEIDAYAEAYRRARGRHPDRYDAGWKALDRCRGRLNRRAASASPDPDVS